MYVRSSLPNDVFTPPNNTMLKVFNINGGHISASGNIMSLVSKNCETTTLSNYAFCGAFYNCSCLVAAPELPATSLGQFDTYRNMFNGCISLEKPPLVLPAKNVC